ncbi:Uncharacterized isomerase yddE [Aedoeadaptatus ivorii]|uniref:Uncharacterized isomerase yddE n=1 Tax=Aedoeadaptatus ivorii TaxID=54006 RepID=A0A448V2W1_9FIRM|nr:PhzF family phenazine biosynthesis isomerase [Peptoniphilus ivorii]VEJ36123.1 Uncharacterized isomerase yddE [Peptoniphilus ivorii]
MKQCIVDAFTDRVFAGNPAAVVFLDAPLDDATMLSIAKENNLSETAFVKKEGDGYRLRWFTPKEEIDLCGHATLATAYALFRFEDAESPLAFQTLSGTLTVRREEDLYAMDFPAYDLKEVPVTDAMEAAIGIRPEAAYMDRDLVMVFDADADLESIAPKEEDLLALDGLLQHVTKPGTEHDCISRSFAPKVGIYEDPVCGSGHCHISVYWKERLEKEDILAYQASPRGGTLYTRVEGDRVTLAGHAALFSKGEILTDEA